MDRLATGGPVTLYRAAGCDACGHTGYSGRSAILEILQVSDELRRLVLSNSDASGIRRQALAEGMIPMRQDGFLKALRGVTSVEEVLRVTPEQAE